MKYVINVISFGQLTWAGFSRGSLTSRMFATVLAITGTVTVWSLTLSPGVQAAVGVAMLLIGITIARLAGTAESLGGPAA